MSAERLKQILEDRFHGDLEEMAKFLEISVEELEGMLDGKIPIPDWVWRWLEPAPEFHNL
ncbi:MULTISPECIES: hypothetical protein [Acidiphilium]|uniref:hypothetical protein n=1 Tax=Acidiphilium TaxID=522 RepID=UPI0011154AE6|nr:MULTISPECIES: hypothetical protein [Acidiphilium]